MQLSQQNFIFSLVSPTLLLSLRYVTNAKQSQLKINNLFIYSENIALIIVKEKRELIVYINYWYN